MNFLFTQPDQPIASKVETTLIDLAALTRRVGWIAYERLPAATGDLLQRLLALFEAQKGAILLHDDAVVPVVPVVPAEQSHRPVSHTSHTSYTPPLLQEKTLRTMALHNMIEEDAYSLLAALPATNALEQPLIWSCWLIYRLVLGETEEPRDHLAIWPEALQDMHGQVENVQNVQNAQNTQYALLVLGWDGGQEAQSSENAERISRCSRLLPLVAHAVGASITTILLREHMHDLEQRSMREALGGMELFKAELLGTVSHELRSPLASIKGYAATLLRHERRLAREERHQFLLAINEASDRLEIIIERLLEVSQLETGQVILSRSPVDMAYLAGEAISAIEERINASMPGRFTFSLHLGQSDDAPAHSVPLILADPRRVREVLDNLLENAVRYSPEGGVINVTIRPSHSMLEIDVSDCGQGIPVEHLDRIFERFHRVDTRLTREVNGLGLGLTMCKRIVELHGGMIWAENRSHGQGSTFYIRLPIEDVEVYM